MHWYPVMSSSSIYAGVIHRKVRGDVTLTASSLTFRPTSTVDEPSDSSSNAAALAAGLVIVIPWSTVSKHQVSPASHPKCLLRLLLTSSSTCTSSRIPSSSTSSSKPESRPTRSTCTSNSSAKAIAKSFELSSRSDLDKIRRDITNRLAVAKSAQKQQQQQQQQQQESGIANGSKKRKRRLQPEARQFEHVESDALAVARSSLLSSDPSLRARHRHLVEESRTVSEEDFWSAPGTDRAVRDEYARIHGKVRAGQSSSIRSNLDLGARGRVRLGVEEMRQIFLMYPAVHKVYEAKVPLELSEEQFWRKYLESEFFHRDRGRIGAHVGRVNAAEMRDKDEQAAAAAAAAAGAAAASAAVGVDDDNDGDDDNGQGDSAGASDNKDATPAAAAATAEDEAAVRVAAAGSNDLFLRLESELKSAKGGVPSAGIGEIIGSRTGGARLALGQFDLASTASADRGERVLNAADLHPQSSAADDGGTTSRVIDKYNRHWAMVLNSDDVAAGCDLGDVARRSAADRVHDNVNNDAKVNGGVDEEMHRLVGFASATEESADHVHCVGDAGDDGGGGEVDGLFEELLLRNVGAYSGRVGSDTAGVNQLYGMKLSAELAKKRGILSLSLADTTREMVGHLFRRTEEKGGERMDYGYPPAALGKELLAALTKRMSQNSQADTDASALMNALPDEFKEKLNSYFRRSSELLRHFFGIRDGMGTNSSCSEVDVQKLSRIVKGMEKVYREMEVIRKDLPQSRAGDAMRKMCLPIMEQLDWAFKLHRDDGGSRGVGGFVTVEDL